MTVKTSTAPFPAAAASVGPTLLLDCDPGCDDAVALLTACAFGALAGVTTVAGNSRVDTTTRNAEVACRVFGYRGEIASGASSPLIGTLAAFAPTAPFSDFDERDAESMTASCSPIREDAARFIVERADPATWLVATGPLTNLALALRRDARLANRVAGLSLMGGSAGAGNITPVAEFNIWSDPEAAHIVLTSGLPIRMCGLDVTHRVLVDRAFTQRIRRLDTRCARFVAHLLETFIDTYPDAFVGQPFAPLHDPCAVLAVTHPALFEWRDEHVAVELSGTLTRGMTVFDRRDTSKLAPNVQTATACDPGAILEAIFNAVERVGRAAAA